MVVVKLLGILDISIAMCFWIFGIFGWIPENFILLIGLFLLGKGVVFLTGLSVASVLDILAAIVIVIASGYDLPNVIIIIVSLFLVQKGIMCLLN